MGEDNAVPPDLADLLIHSRKPVTERLEKVEIDTGDTVVTVTVRGLARSEYLIASKRFGDDEIAKEQFLASCALVDPKLTMEQVGQWQKVSGPQEINQLMMKVNDLSGVKSGADKS